MDDGAEEEEDGDMGKTEAREYSELPKEPFVRAHRVSRSPIPTNFVTKFFGCTAEKCVMKKNLDGLIVSGGGDGLEAQTAALADALNLE